MFLTPPPTPPPPAVTRQATITIYHGSRGYRIILSDPTHQTYG